MKKYIITSLALLLAVSFWNCEKDDICSEDTPTTPQLVIEFYDKVNQIQLKNVTKLRVEESGTDIGVVFNESLKDTNPAKFLSNDNKISIPLKTFDDNSQYEFILNYGETTEKTDIITINYSRTETYISRACGYKTTFILNDTNGFVAPTLPNWIFDYEIVQPNINNENETHVKIYF